MSEATELQYKKIFDPSATAAQVERRAQPAAEQHADRRDGLVYIYTEEIELAVNVALATKRPLLIRGPSGSGKSSLARNVALHLRWRYYEKVITSSTQAHDLEAGFDALARFADAQVKKLKSNEAYVSPGVLWWAFDPESAKRRGVPKGRKAPFTSDDPSGPAQESGAVVLLDEIDKADPEVPNNLLVTLGSLVFEVKELDVKVSVAPDIPPPLLIITSNDERELPSAFLRRCVTLELQPPTQGRLVEIAKKHFGEDHAELYEKAAALITKMAGQQEGVATPSTAEYLDAVSACLKLKISPDAKNRIWGLISKATMWKSRDLPVTQP